MLHCSQNMDHQPITGLDDPFRFSVFDAKTPAETSPAHH